MTRHLRREVGYGCPECRKPLLTFHHFDPTWRAVEELCAREGRRPTAADHKAGGMIALCQIHHDYADGGGYTRAHLHALKTKEFDPRSVRHQYPWASGELLVRVGGNYISQNAVPLSFAGETIVELERGPENLLQVSFSLRNSDDTIVLIMDQNTFSADADQLFDLICSPQQQSIVAHMRKGEVALDLQCKRLAVDELREIVVEDSRAAARIHNQHLAKRRERMPQTMRAHLNDVADDAFADTVEAIVEHATAHSLDEDGTVPLLDFRRLVTHRRGRKLEIGNGLMVGSMTASFNFVAGGAAAFVLG